MAFAFLLTLGVLCAVIGGVLLWLGFRTTALAGARAAARPVTLAELAARSEPAREMVTVSGTARPGPDGVLRSPVSRTASVWWRVLVVRKDTNERSDPSTEAPVRSTGGIGRCLGHRDRGTVMLDDGTAKVAVDMVPVIPDDRWRTSASETVRQLADATFYLRDVHAPADYRTDGYRQGEYAVPPADRISFTGRLFFDGEALTVAQNEPLYLDRPSAAPPAATPRSKQPQFVAGVLLAAIAVLALAGAVIAAL